MATIYFTNLNDTTDTTSELYAGSLRAAVASAAAGDIIKPDASLSGGTINLVAEIAPTVKVIIDGSELEERITIDGGSGWNGGYYSRPTEGCRAFNFVNAMSSEVHNFIFSHCAVFSGSGGTVQNGSLYNCYISYSYQGDSTLENGGGGTSGSNTYNCTFRYCYGRFGGSVKNGVHINCEFRNSMSNWAGGVAYYADFRCCTFYPCTGGNAIFQMALNRTVKNCLFVNCYKIYRKSGNNQVLFEGNTVIGATQIREQDSTVDVIVNNLWNVESSAGGAQSGNFLYQTTDESADNYAGKVFKDFANGDYRLRDDSPALDAGDNSKVTTATDIAGNPRVVGGTVDCGAYENQLVALTAPTIEAGEAKKYSAKIESVASEHAISFEYRIGTGTASPLPTESGVGTVYNLSPNTTYSIQVRAVGDGESYRYSTWSNAVSVQTLSGGLNFFVWEARRESSHTDLKQQQEMFRASILDYETNEQMPSNLVSSATFTAYTDTDTAHTPVPGFSQISVPVSAFSQGGNYNFTYVPDQVYKYLFNASGTYSAQVKINLTSGNPIQVVYENITVQ